jgi:hypothetical protein
VEDVNMVNPQEVIVDLDWSEAEESSSQHVNQVLAQLGPPSLKGVPDGIYLALGSISPPIIPPDDKRREARVAELTDGILKVAVHGRYQISRETLRDIIDVLQQTAEQYDSTVASIKR